jgi:hypothetical protein
MADGNQRAHQQGSGGAAQALVVDGLPPCTMTPTADGRWHVLAQLTAEEQAALTAAAPSPNALCRQAQHALGLAGIGSRIAPDHTAIGVYAAPLQSSPGAIMLVLEGHAMLWVLSRASSEAIRTLIAAATSAMHNAPHA